MRRAADLLDPGATARTTERLLAPSGPKAKSFPTLGMVTTSSDAAFAKQLGVELAEYLDFLEAQRGAAAADDSDDAQRTAGNLNISWLPEGFDLTKALLDDDVSPPA